MLVEGTFTLLFNFEPPQTTPLFVPLLCLAISTAMWLITFSKLVPLQDQLTIDGLNTEVVEKLIQINWIRTIGWTLKVLILIFCVAKMVFLA